MHASAADYDLLTVIMLCLGGAEDESDGLPKLLSVLLSSEMGAEKKKDILQNDFDIPMTVTMREEAENMCNLSDEVWEKGLAKGRAEGHAEGLAEGMINAIRGLIINTGWSIEQAMAALSVPEADRPKYRKFLQEK